MFCLRRHRTLPPLENQISLSARSTVLRPPSAASRRGEVERKRVFVVEGMVVGGDRSSVLPEQIANQVGYKVKITAERLLRPSTVNRPPYPPDHGQQPYYWPVCGCRPQNKALGAALSAVANGLRIRVSARVNRHIQH